MYDSSPRSSNNPLWILQDYISNLLDEHREVLEPLEAMPLEELVQSLLGMEGQMSKGLPVSPPADFVTRVDDSISEDDWRLLTALLQDWHASVRPPECGSFSERDLRLLALALQWQSAVVLEYARRSQALVTRNGFALVR